MSTVQEDSMREQSRKMKDRELLGKADTICCMFGFSRLPFGNVSNVSNACKVVAFNHLSHLSKTALSFFAGFQISGCPWEILNGIMPEFTVHVQNLWWMDHAIISWISEKNVLHSTMSVCECFFAFKSILLYTNIINYDMYIYIWQLCIICQ